MTLDYPIGGLTASRVLGIRYDSLDHWINEGVFQVTKAAKGKGSRRVFSFMDLVKAQATSELRAQGVPLETIRRALDLLAEHPEIPESAMLLIAGDTVRWAADRQSAFGAAADAVFEQEMTVGSIIIMLYIGKLVAHVRRKVAEQCGAS